MRSAVLIFCLFSLTGCGLAKRFIPRPKLSPRVILVQNDAAPADPCMPDGAVLALASVYGRETPSLLPS
ncbi:MAG: hypothetical protein IPH06_10410 [Alphaproteobacteria bacterium]|jgi:hypothetical protein|nr:hypothetical protein [Alphaproteobacteria bacterium]QQS58397.1 MAG: hypothetical protein IPN28_06165 [Alphaproteobacteria bacterium]